MSENKAPAAVMLPNVGLFGHRLLDHTDDDHQDGPPTPPPATSLMTLRISRPPA
jgi:hypothetical protein